MVERNPGPTSDTTTKYTQVAMPVEKMPSTNRAPHADGLSEGLLQSCNHSAGPSKINDPRDQGAGCNGYRIESR